MVRVGLTVFVLAMLLLGAVTPSKVSAIDVSTQDANDLAAQTDAYELRYLGEDVDVVVGMRPAKWVAKKELPELFAAAKKVLLQETAIDLAPEQIEQFVVGYTAQLPNCFDSYSIYVRLKEPIKLDAARVKATPSKIAGQDVFRFSRGLMAWQPDERTIVVNSDSRIAKFVEGRTTVKAFTSSAAWARVSQGDAFALTSGRFARMALGTWNDAFMYVHGIINEAHYVGLAATLKNDIQVTMVVECQDETGPKHIRVIVSNAAALTRATRNEAERNTPNDPNDDASSAKLKLSRLAQSVLDLLESATPNVDGRHITLSLQLPAQSFPDRAVAAMIGGSQTAANQKTSMENLRQIGLAIHLFERDNRILPRATSVIGSNHPLSWRVALLPFLNQQDLYNKYNRDEPWDSPGNRKVLALMPAVYRHPSEPSNSTNTSYVVLTGPMTMFPTNRNMRFFDINDGLSKTIAVVEAKTSIPWTKPEDYEYAADKDLPKLGGYQSDGFCAVFADIFVRFLPHPFEEKRLRGMITAVGGEDLN